MSWTTAVPWLLLAVYGAALIGLAPRSRGPGGFYEGRDSRGRAPSLGFLFGSIFIAWIFAKSVTNAANLGATFGLPGAVAYAGYWLSIPVAGLVIVTMRRRDGARSLTGWLVARYGRVAATTFLLAILIRLYNEVWSNTAVVGTYFGDKGSTAYYAGALVFTALTLGYTLKGGLRTSIWTDAIHAGVFAALLVVIAALTLPRVTGGEVSRVVSTGSWTLAGGVDLLVVALLQSLSYPFHDPVLTDRAFLSDPRTTLKAFFLAGGAGALAITLFGTLGVAAFLSGAPIDDDAPRVVASSIGIGVLTMVNVVMLASAGSTVDSTFSAVAKAVNVDAPGVRGRGPSGLTAGRVAMVAAAILGNLPLFAGTAILEATTISGTMVLGLAPVFVLGLFLRAPALSFHLAFWIGVATGVIDVLGLVPSALRIGDGSYAGLLGANVWGLLLATVAFLAPWLWRLARRTPIVEPVRDADREIAPAPAATA
ncbi:MAG: sodium:solute symporter family transporter, partial [Gemmatimonadota bacterium]